MQPRIFDICYQRRMFVLTKFLPLIFIALKLILFPFRKIGISFNFVFSKLGHIFV